MKKFLLFSVLVFLVLMKFSDSFSQSTANYVFATSTTGSLTDMTTGTTQLIAANVDDGASAVTNIGFEFWFMGTRYAQFTASSNGAMRLGTTAISGTSYGNAYPFTTNAMLAPFMGDLFTSPTGKVHYKLTGSAPNRVLIVEWFAIDCDYNSLTADATYQCLLYEGSSKIEFKYGFMSIASISGDPVYSVGIAATTTANNFAMVDQDLNTVSTTVITRKTYLATGEVTNLSSAADGSRRVYSFTPATPVAPSALNFTAVTGAGMTLNWTDNSSDESGFAVYRSDDGGTTYNFITKTAANAVSFAATGLASSSTYNWRVYAVREIPSSTFTNGAQATSAGTFSGTKTVGTYWRFCNSYCSAYQH